MNIAVDVQPLISPTSKNRGIGNYNKDQLRLLIEKDNKNNYIFFNAYNDDSISEILDVNLSEFNNVKDIHIYTGEMQYLIKNKEYAQVFGEIVKKFLLDNKIDVFYFTSPFDYWDIFNIEWFESVSTIATVYDIIPFLFPNRYLPDDNSRKWYMKIIQFIKKVDRIVAISESVKEDLIKHVGISEDKIDVIYAGIDKRYKKLDSISDEIQIKEKYGIDSEFIMCTGGADPRKNMNELIIAYSKLPEELKNKYKLAIVCSLHKEGEIELRETAEKFNVSGRVVMTNFVPFDHLLKLYNMASLMAFPSQYEGFGLPVIEAMACGTKVLTSNNSSLGEIAEGAATIVDPFDIKSITEGLKTALNDLNSGEFLEEMDKRVNLYTWENTVKLTMESISKIQFKKKLEGLEYSRDNIAMFTPLPPIKSGISDYSYDIIMALCQYFDIDVYVDDNYTGNPFDSNEHVEVYNHREYKANKNKYCDTIFQVGNSEFHIYMFDYIKKYRGTVVLHDYNMHGLIYFVTGEKGNYHQYERMLAEDDKELARKYVDEVKCGMSGLKIHDIEANGIVTNYANKIIVHSDYAKRKLLNKDISKNVARIPLYTKIEEVQNKVKLREKYGLDKDEFIIASFGFVSDTKRIDKALEAFSIVVKEKSNIRYLLVGEASKDMEKQINNFCEDKNIKSKVNITGFTKLEEFIDYIGICDVCINLRYPYNGETSASLMRILGAGKPVIVSDIGSFSEIPDECCVKVPISKVVSDTTEVNMLTDVLMKMVKDKNYIEELSRNARMYSEKELDINIVVKKYRDFILKEKNIIITEEAMRELIKNEVGKANNKDMEIYKISKTLSQII